MSVQIIRGNALDLPIADSSVDLVVTSPPYFGLRSYQDGGEHYDGQIGDEATPAEFVDALIAATREMMRVVKPSGSIWVNLGDRFSDGMFLDRSGMTEADAAWLAGVIDSDGSISVHINKQPEGRAPSFVPWVRVGQMKPEVVEQIAAVTGTGKVSQDGRGVWNWGASAQQAANVLRLIWPWLHIKQRQALAAIELARHIGETRNKGTWSRVTPESIAYRQMIREAVLDWNAGRPNDYQPPRIPKVDLPRGRTFIPAKSLAGVPWRYAIRCIDELGLILRAEVIWSKANGLPESVTDRVRRSHEQWFHFTLNPRYYSAVDEIREAHVSARPGTGGLNKRGDESYHAFGGAGATGKWDGEVSPLGKLPGSVWTIATEPLRVPDHLGVDHFAAFPMEWPRRIITGWSPRGVCVECGEGRRPVRDGAWHFTEPGHEVSRRALDKAKAAGVTAEIVATQYGLKKMAGGNHSDSANNVHPDVLRLAKDFSISVLAATNAVSYATRGMGGYACDCPEPTAPTTPGVVLDPFGGTGTTALVADALGRHGISVDMSADYCRLAEWRTSDPKQRAKAAQKPYTPPAEQVEGQASLLDLIEETA